MVLFINDSMVRTGVAEDSVAAAGLDRHGPGGSQSDKERLDWLRRQSIAIKKKLGTKAKNDTAYNNYMAEYKKIAKKLGYTASSNISAAESLFPKTKAKPIIITVKSGGKSKMGPMSAAEVAAWIADEIVDDSTTFGKATAKGNVITVTGAKKSKVAEIANRESFGAKIEITASAGDVEAAGDMPEDRLPDRKRVTIQLTGNNLPRVIQLLKAQFENVKVNGNTASVETSFPNAVSIGLRRIDPGAKVMDVVKLSGVVSAASTPNTNARYIFPNEQAASAFVDTILRMGKGLKAAYKGRAAVVLNPGVYAAEVSDAARKAGGKPPAAGASVSAAASATAFIDMGGQFKTAQDLMRAAKSAGLTVKSRTLPDGIDVVLVGDKAKIQQVAGQFGIKDTFIGWS